MNKAAKNHAEKHQQQRRAARLRAVQALFQMDIGGMGAKRVIAEFREDRLEGNDDSGVHGEADAKLFGKLVLGVVDIQSEIDDAIRAHLAKDWSLERLDATLRALLRCAAFEVINLRETPIKVILEAYVDIAGDFFSGPEPGFVNAALEALARDERKGELAQS